MNSKEQKIRYIELNNKLEQRKYSSLISERYPNVEEIKIEMLLDYPNVFSEHKREDSKIFKPHDKAYFEIDCINKDCVFSDLSLDSEVFTAINQQLESFKDRKICHGYNTFSCYERKSGTCMTNLDYEIKITYKNANGDR